MVILQMELSHIKMAVNIKGIWKEDPNMDLHLNILFLEEIDLLELFNVINLLQEFTRMSMENDMKEVLTMGK